MEGGALKPALATAAAAAGVRRLLVGVTATRAAAEVLTAVVTGRGAGVRDGWSGLGGWAGSTLVVATPLSTLSSRAVAAYVASKGLLDGVGVDALLVGGNCRRGGKGGGAGGLGGVGEDDAPLAAVVARFVAALPPETGGVANVVRTAAKMGARGGGGGCAACGGWVAPGTERGMCGGCTRAVRG